MKLQITLLSLLVLAVCSCQNKKKEEIAPVVQTDSIVDMQATPEVKKLYTDLKERMRKGIMFGHQDDLAYGHGWYRQQDRSDVKDVCGDYPAVIGWELGHLELGAEFNLDSVYFSDMKRYVQEAHRRGSINTMSWHGDNIVTGKTAWDCKGNTVVKSVLPGAENHDKFLVWLDHLAIFFSDLKDDNGTLIPIIFRMYHEHTGNWFWWGRDQSTPEEYKQLWTMTVEYLRDKKNVHNLLYAYSPGEFATKEEYTERYPGNGYVDILGFDTYVPGKDGIDHYKQAVDLDLGIVTAFAAETNKIPCLSETGMESVADSTYFTQILYPAISKYKISYVMLWRNAWEPDKSAHHYYVPYPGHPACDDFRKFVEMPDILMSKDIQKTTN